MSSIWKPCCCANSAAPLPTNMLNEACSSTHRATDIGLAYLKSEHIYKRDKNTASKKHMHQSKEAKAALPEASQGTRKQQNILLVCFKIQVQLCPLKQVQLAITESMQRQKIRVALFPLLFRKETSLQKAHVGLAQEQHYIRIYNPAWMESVMPCLGTKK